jgi:hypothetical protein
MSEPTITLTDDAAEETYVFHGSRQIAQADAGSAWPGMTAYTTAEYRLVVWEPRDREVWRYTSLAEFLEDQPIEQPPREFLAAIARELGEPGPAENTN